MQLPESIRSVMPLHQQRIIANCDEHRDTIARLEEEVAGIPRQNEDNLVYAHFFYAGCDWFVMEWDRKNEIVFGYAILNGDLEMSELGSSYLSDLTEDGRIELDFYWKKCSLREALHDKYPGYFP